MFTGVIAKALFISRVGLCCFGYSYEQVVLWCFGYSYEQLALLQYFIQFIIDLELLFVGGITNVNIGL